MYRLTAAVVAAAALFFCGVAPASATEPIKPDGATGPSAILVLIPQDPDEDLGFDEQINDGFARIDGLSVGLMSSTQGSYEASQALLDMSQGTRVSRSTYDPKDTPQVLLRKDRILGGGLLANWVRIVERADTAPQTIVPGLLASTIPEGAAYVGTGATHQKTAIPAADEQGHIAAIDLSNKPDAFGAQPIKAWQLAARYPFVVFRTKAGQAGLKQLSVLLRLRRPDQVVIATQSPPESINIPLLPVAVAGIGDGTTGITSPTTNTGNLVAGIDIAPTVLDHLGIDIPDDMRGRPMEAEGEADPASLVPFRDRLSSLGPRRLPSLGLLFAGWLGIFLVVGAIIGRDRARMPVRRLGGLAVLWIPTTILIPAAIGNPPALAEYFIIAGAALLLGWLTDRFVPWPRAPLVPAIVGLGVITIDLAFGSHLITRSILGPNPGYGSRFYGVGNELKSGLTVIMLAGVAAFLTGRPKSNRNALIVLVTGLALGAILGSGRLGAGVGAAIIVASATAVAAMMMLPGRLTRKRIAILVAAPVIGLAILAILDLLTAGGQGHYSHNVLGLTSWDTASEIITRRSTLAWQQLKNGNMPVITLLCLLAAAYAIRNRDMFRPWDGPVWPAALVGGLVGGLIGSVTEDSGPMLIVVATITLAGVCSYLLGRPPSTDRTNAPNGGTSTVSAGNASDSGHKKAGSPPEA